jgi:hypothetical protein
MHINSEKLVSMLATIMFVMGLMSANARADILEDTFRDFSLCDASFFRDLNRNADTLKSMAALESHGDSSWFKVKNRFDEKGNYVDFKNQPKLAGLTLLSYFDETSDLGDMGLYYYWGFTFEGALDDVIQKLRPLISNPERFHFSDGAFARTEVKVLGSRWLPLTTNSNTPTGNGKIERVFLIEAHETRKNAVRVSCSLQGGVTADVLKEIRPDIDPKEYPKQLSKVLFDDVPVPDNVLQTARSVAWSPKFKKLSYTYVNSNRPGNGPVTVEMEGQGGLVRVKEIYSSSFNVQRLMLGGMVQLKSRMNGIGDGRVYLTTNLQMTLPTVMEKGAKINMTSIAKSEPEKTGDKENSLSMFCEVGEQFDAEEIFRELTGKAHKLTCMRGDAETSELAFLDDLGIVVTLSSKSRYGNGAYKFTRFEIEK